MATHSSILAWEIPWTEEPARIQLMGSQSQTRLSTHTHDYLMSFTNASIHSLIHSSTKVCTLHWSATVAM